MVDRARNNGDSKIAANNGGRAPGAKPMKASAARLLQPSPLTRREINLLNQKARNNVLFLTLEGVKEPVQAKRVATGLFTKSDYVSVKLKPGDPACAHLERLAPPIADKEWVKFHLPLHDPEVRALARGALNPAPAHAANARLGNAPAPLDAKQPRHAGPPGLKPYDAISSAMAVRSRFGNGNDKPQIVVNGYKSGEVVALHPNNEVEIRFPHLRASAELAEHAKFYSYANGSCHYRFVLGHAVLLPGAELNLQVPPQHVACIPEVGQVFQMPLEWSAFPADPTSASEGWCRRIFPELTHEDRQQRSYPVTVNGVAGEVVGMDVGRQHICVCVDKAHADPLRKSLPLVREEQRGEKIYFVHPYADAAVRAAYARPQLQQDSKAAPRQQPARAADDSNAAAAPAQKEFHWARLHSKLPELDLHIRWEDAHPDDVAVLMTGEGVATIPRQMAWASPVDILPVQSPNKLARDAALLLETASKNGLLVEVHVATPHAEVLQPALLTAVDVPNMTFTVDVDGRSQVFSFKNEEQVKRHLFPTIGGLGYQLSAWMAALLPGVRNDAAVKFGVELVPKEPGDVPVPAEVIGLNYDGDHFLLRIDKRACASVDGLWPHAVLSASDERYHYITHSYADPHVREFYEQAVRKNAKEMREAAAFADVFQV